MTYLVVVKTPLLISHGGGGSYGGGRSHGGGHSWSGGLSRYHGGS